MEKATLSTLQCLNFTFPSQEVLVKELHQLIGCVIFHWPQAHHERLCPSSQECSPQPQLFITATDTGAGKTVIACAIARLWRREARAFRVCKPVATGASLRAGKLVSEDTLALARAADAATREC